MGYRPNDYSRDKSGWVTFANGKKKIKLRKHVDNVAKKIHSYKLDTKSHSEIRQSVVDAYDKEGLDGIKSLAISCMTEAHKQMEEHLIKMQEALKETDYKTKDQL